MSDDAHKPDTLKEGNSLGTHGRDFRTVTLQTNRVRLHPPCKLSRKTLGCLIPNVPHRFLGAGLPACDAPRSQQPCQPALHPVPRLAALRLVPRRSKRLRPRQVDLNPHVVGSYLGKGLTNSKLLKPLSTLARIRRTREAGGRVVAVGTTVVRALPYLALGVISSEFWADHAGAGNPVDFARARFNGVTLAAGVDVAVNQSMFVRGEIQAVRYRNGVLPFYAGTDPHTLSARDVRLSVGVGWRF